MSPRAAWRLARLGFDVYDYVAGKADWLAAGLPTVRAEPAARRALDEADRSPPTCAPDTPVSALPAGNVLVVNAEGIVLGRVPADRQTRGSSAAEDMMEPGPTTVRADEPFEPLLERMKLRVVSEIIVTTPEGQLLGVINRDE